MDDDLELEVRFSLSGYIPRFSHHTGKTGESRAGLRKLVVFDPRERLLRSRQQGMYRHECINATLNTRSLQRVTNVGSVAAEETDKRRETSCQKSQTRSRKPEKCQRRHGRKRTEEETRA